MRFVGWIVAAALTVPAAPGAAEVWQYGQSDCNQLWFMRNLIMDRAGYCFGTNLGKSLYDNGDCTGKQVHLSGDESRQVKKIKALETRIGCKVNTGGTSLDVPMKSNLLRLRDMPLPADGGWGCLGWAGRAAPIHDGYSSGRRVIGSIDPGDNVFFGFLGEGGWSPVIVAKGGNGGKEILGWIDASLDPVCTSEAG
ncbi:YARHG domain-containing protein [Aliiruegeria haliotis]|uniref:YARHG domain-containing protein n=1 Tax=Aliiruegeria haliotis TaxID=1280846 RepID=A0A2T0RZ87_9RHOB|nr:DUF4453 domain-containing protein [Aliiruegeria haliotis]PRY26499.1 YARHG domain-containing protein [Aliiruegeria haliotis]